MDFLTDNHIHSTCSPDAENTMLEMALASHKMGVRKLCFTDHCDLDDHNTGLRVPDCYHFRPKMLKQYEEAKAAVPPDMELFLGLELGEGNHDPEVMKRVSESPELDFVLGSLHNLDGVKDFYDLGYPDGDFCRKILDRYMEELIELAGLEYFDVMAHVCYPIRYMRKRGFKDVEMNVRTHGDGLTELFKKLIETGRGIEINCSGLRNDWLRETIPSRDVVKLYKELGGEIITLGSDAHQTCDAGVGLAEGLALLRELDFKYVTIFRNRKPEFIKI